ncbi:MAG TPA: NADH-quinone oxidoreductase subunit N [Casimicrobiaceae bacterium]|jgi:NADH-quinone oxidoreductase subunit N|nr:NADH-quinone oxidoreductase subunit N [Casimicrobiaceae bacterium]
MSWQAIFTAMLPEHFLLAGIVVLIGLEIAPSRSRGAFAVALLAVTAATAAAVWLSFIGHASAPFPGQYSVDPVAALGKAIVLALAVLVLLIAHDEFGQRAFPILLLSSLYGICLLLSADSFLTLFLGLELMSLPVYALVLLAFRRPESAEAALKYLVLGGTATATLLMGVSLLYGSSGSLALSVFADALSSTNTMAGVAVVLVVVGFFLKAAIVPFHAWAPDAYEAAAVPVTAYMAAIIKAGVLLAAVRLFDNAPLSRPMADILAILPLLSIVWGNLAAMRQQSFRRMIGYSSIAHAGYLFYAFLGEGPGRFQAVAFYVLVYGLMNVLAFAALPQGPNDAARDRLDNLKGLFRRDPFAALMIGIAMLSLAGIPPFPGFIAKFLIFKNVIAAGFTLYAVLGLIGSYLGIYFYLRVIQYLFMSAEEPTAVQGAPKRLALGASFICLLAAILLAVFPGWVIGQL